MLRCPQHTCQPHIHDEPLRYCMPGCPACTINDSRGDCASKGKRVGGVTGRAARRVAFRRGTPVWLNARSPAARR
eukprot:7176904-Prymnesium_polylepis.1